MRANAGPSSDHVAAIESTPVWGVVIKKEVAAPREAPLRRREMVVGSTPQEHKGSGTPTKAAFSAGFHPCPDKWRDMASRGTNTWMMPAIKKPSKM